METALESENISAPFHFASYFKRCFNRVGASGAAELNPIIQIFRLKKRFLQQLQKMAFGIGVHVQPMQNAVIL